ncbi:MAG TPA: Ig-like domain-containing protein [Candidatus Angelobacter sp.]
MTTTAAEVVALTDKTVNDFAGPLLKYYRNVAFADMVVPAPVPPPPAPLIGISLFKEVPDPNPDPNGPQPAPPIRQDAGGIIVDGTPLVIAFKTNGTISQPPGVTINGVSYATQQDAPAKPTDPNKLDFELSQHFTSNGPGIYKIVVTGLTAFAQSITVSKTFLVVGAGGDNNAIRVGEPPQVINTIPVAGAQGVPVNTFIQIQFSEPVVNVPGNVTLVPDDGSTPPDLNFTGINYKTGLPIANLGNTDAVSSVTIQPVEGLKYGMHYTLNLTSAIQDLDNIQDPTKPALGLKQPDSPIGFTTFGPQALGGTSNFSSTRPVVLGNRVYVAVQNGTLAFIQAYDLSDPANPVQVDIGTGAFIGRAQDAAGEENAPVIGGGDLLAVGAGVGGFDFGLPSNLWLYNVSGAQIQRVGAVSVTGSTVNEGQILRVALKGNFAYTGTFPLGIQVVDLQQAISDYNDVFANDPTEFGQQITTDGEGFARDAVVNTIPIKDANGRNFMVFGLKGGDFVVPGSDPANPTLQTLVVATGTVPGAIPNSISLVVADPTNPGPPSYAGPLTLGNASVDSGNALDLGQLTDSILDANGNPVQIPVAVVVGRGTASPDPANPGQVSAGGVLGVVDLTNPSLPQLIGIVKLDTFPTDIVLKGATALIGTGENRVLLVNLNDPRHPINAGSFSAAAFGDRLALTSDGILVGSSLNGSLGGVHTALTSPAFVILSVSPAVINVDSLGNTIDPINVDYLFLGDLSTIASASVELLENNQTKLTLPLTDLSPGRHTATFAPGIPVKLPPQTVEVSVIRPDGTRTSSFMTSTAPDPPSSATTTTATLQTPAKILLARSSPPPMRESRKETADDRAPEFAGIDPASPVSPMQDSAPLPPELISAILDLSPDNLAVGDITSFVTLGFSNIDPTQPVFALDTQDNWSPINLTVQPDDTVGFTLPGNLAGSAGLLYVSPSQDVFSGAALTVRDVSLPSIGTSSSIIAGSLNSPSFDSDNLLLEVNGQNFANGMKIVIGKDNIPITVLTTVFVSNSVLQANLPNWALRRTESMFAAVLSVDGSTLSNALLFSRTVGADEDGQETAVEGPPPDPSTAFRNGDVEILGSTKLLSSPLASRVSGFELEGVGLTEGASVQFHTTRAGVDQVVTTSLSAVMDASPFVPSGAFALPNSPATLAPTALPNLAQTQPQPSGPCTVIQQAIANLAKAKQGRANLTGPAATPVGHSVQAKAQDKNGAVVAQSAPKTVTGADPLEIPFGGRVKIVVYKDGKNNNYILTDSEKSSIANSSSLMAQSDVVPSIEITDGGALLFHIEQENKVLYFRGLHLNKVPGATTERPAANLKIGDKVIRQAKVIQHMLGSNPIYLDDSIAKISDKYGLPPQYLKSQAITESASYTANFKYEPGTIDFGRLSGDGAANATRAPYLHYLFAGQRLMPNHIQTQAKPFTADLAVDANHTVFQLPKPLMRSKGGIGGDVPVSIKAVIETPNGQSVTTTVLTQVYPNTRWTKGTGQIAATSLTGNNTFAIDYDAGQIQLSRSLLANETLKVSNYYPSPVVTAVSPGDLLGGAPDLNDKNVTKETRFAILYYRPGAMLGQFHTDNISCWPNGQYLATTPADKRLEFKFASAPIAPLDPKYRVTTAQYIASSSYGLVQQTLLAWEGPNANLLSARLDPNQQPFFQLLTDNELSLELAGIIDSANLQRVMQDPTEQGNVCQVGTVSNPVSTCTDTKWSLMWTRAFQRYNRSQAAYAASGTQTNAIIDNGNAHYTPR